jgi:hypothetical protein
MTSEKTNPGDFSATEKMLFIRIFQEHINKAIPTLLVPIWDEKLIKVHPLPNMKGDKLQLYGTNSLTGSSIIAIEEFADYLKLPDVDDPEKVIETIESLAQLGAESYAGNVRNAFIKGGKLRNEFNGERLHITDWHNEFHVNVVKSDRNIDCCPGDDTEGWVSFRYRFAAAKF